jgi:hypothetical protein
MRNPGKGYHDPTKGTYILLLEEYPNEEEAAKRVAKYRNPGYPVRIANPDASGKERESSVMRWESQRAKPPIC